ncbi:MAG: ABC transporter substrate-binding protein [Pseudomonadota bacterium]
MIPIRSARAVPRWLATAVLALAALAWGAPLAAETADPKQVVERIDSTLIEIMQNADELGYAGRYATLEPILDHSFDYAFMARVSAGKYWRDLDEAQRAELIDAFARLSTATFAARFNGYGGEIFEVVGEEERPRNTKLVLNNLTTGDGEVIPINFLLAKRSDDWRVIDVFLDAKFSELAVKRSEFTAVISNEGFDQLIASIEDRIKGLASGS